MASPGRNATTLTPLLSREHSNGESSIRPEDSDARKVADVFPRTVWLIATIELCERFAYFGVVGPLQNYVQNAPDDALRPGGLGLGQAAATMVTQCFLLWCYLTPVVGAVVADQYLGRVKTVVLSSAVYICGLLSLCLSAAALSSDASVQLSRGALFAALALIGIGTGGIKTNVSSLIAEQYVSPAEQTRTTSSGEVVMMDKDLTIQRIFSMFFIFINIGSFAASVCPAIEQRYGFTRAFALPTTVFILGFAILLSGRREYVTHKPDSSVVFHAVQASWTAVRHGWSYTRSPPSAAWDPIFIDELRSALSACKVFLLYPLYWAACSQLVTGFVSQATAMQTHGLPNDLLVFLDPVVAVLLLPLLDRAVFPYLRRTAGLTIGHRFRMTAGFLCIGAAMLYAAFVQARIYAAPPCYKHPRAADCAGGGAPNDVSVFWQVPGVVLVAASEILAAVAALEYAYARAPAGMRSLVMAVNLSTTSAGALLAAAAAPWAADPGMVGMYLGLAAGPLVSAGFLGMMGIVT